MMKTMTRAALLPLLAAALGACADATGSSGGSGDATMRVNAIGDNGSGPQATRSADGARYVTTTANGTVDFTARAYVQTSAGGWTELTGGAAQHAVVDASGHAGAVAFATGHVSAGAYGRVRLVFENVHGNLSSGLQVSSGLLTGSVNVDMQGDGSVTVERSVSVTAGAGATTNLLIDLNSDVWMNQASATSHTVSEAAFASAVQVTAS